MKSSVRFCIVHACVTLAAFGYPAIAADSSAYGESVAAQRDGKIVVAGYAEPAASINSRSCVTTSMGVWTRASMAPAN